MYMKNYPEVKFKKEISDIVREALPDFQYTLFIFGSRVIGLKDDRSDIDIGIHSKSPIPMSAISKIREKFEELPILYKLDLIDFTNATNAFKEKAMSKIEVIDL